MNSHRNIPSEIVSTYRGLLRAAGYLPDSVARNYAYERIRSRFRASRAKGSNLATRTKLQKHGGFRKETVDFTVQRLSKARRLRRLLEDAGNGDLDSLKKVLLAVHGREGERKRMLLRDLLKPDEKALPKDASALQELIETPKTPAPENYVPDPKVLKFIRSQQENQPVEAHKGKIRHLKAKIPEKNIWGRPIPVNLKGSMQKKWWAEILEKLLPPIPRSEWERLRDLATGALPLETQPARRKRLPSTTEEELSSEEKSTQLLQYFQAPARGSIPFSLEGKLEDMGDEAVLPMASGQKSSRAVKDEAGIKAASARMEDRRARKEVRKKSKEHEQAERLAKIEPLSPSPTLTEAESTVIRNRSLRRLYASIWNMTPTMTYNEVNKKWDIEWGGQKSRAMDGAVPKPTLAEEELFEGLDTRPHDVSTAARPKLRAKSDVKGPGGEGASEQSAKDMGHASPGVNLS